MRRCGGRVRLDILREIGRLTAGRPRSPGFEHIQRKWTQARCPLSCARAHHQSRPPVPSDFRREVDIARFTVDTPSCADSISLKVNDLLNPHWLALCSNAADNHRRSSIQNAKSARRRSSADPRTQRVADCPNADMEKRRRSRPERCNIPSDVIDRLSRINEGR